MEKYIYPGDIQRQASKESHSHLTMGQPRLPQESRNLSERYLPFPKG